MHILLVCLNYKKKLHFMLEEAAVWMLLHGVLVFLIGVVVGGVGFTRQVMSVCLTCVPILQTIKRCFFILNTRACTHTRAHECMWRVVFARALSCRGQGRGFAFTSLPRPRKFWNTVRFKFRELVRAWLWWWRWSALRTREDASWPLAPRGRAELFLSKGCSPKFVIQVLYKGI